MSLSPRAAPSEFIFNCGINLKFALKSLDFQVDVVIGIGDGSRIAFYKQYVTDYLL
jgi:hypothetical protein